MSASAPAAALRWSTRPTNCPVSRRGGRPLSLRCIVAGEDLMAEPAARPELLPNLQLDELLAELQSRLQAVLATRDRMRGLLEAGVGIRPGLDPGSTPTRGGRAAARPGGATH